MGLYGEYYGPPDDKDLDLVAARQRLREQLERNNRGFNPLCGDVVIFAGGQSLRISHVWEMGESGLPQSIQTSRGGSWYWDKSGDMSFSGSLLSSIPADSLTSVGQCAEVTAWIFHHDLASAHRGVDVVARVRVWHTTSECPQA